jgi:hypothetical protein
MNIHSKVTDLSQEAAEEIAAGAKLVKIASN